LASHPVDYNCNQLDLRFEYNCEIRAWGPFFSAQLFLCTFVIKIAAMVERIRILLESRQLTPTQFADAIGVARPIVSHILSGRNKPSLEVVQRILAAMPDLAMPWLLNGTGPMLATSTIAPAAADFVAKSSAPPIPVVLSTLESAAASSATIPLAPQVATDTPVLSASQLAVPAMPLPRPITQLPPPNPIGGVSDGVRMPNLPRTGTQPKRFIPNALNVSVPSVAPGIDEEAEELPTAAPATPAPAPVTSASAAAIPPDMEAPAASIEVPANASPPEIAPLEAPSSLASALFAGAEKPIRRIVIFYRDGSFADYQPE
jgi:transcriptional regulator with XRE-family HTH domain